VTKKAELDEKKQASMPSLTSIGMAAMEDERDVKLFNTDTAQFVSVGEGAGYGRVRVLAQVHGNVPMMQQPPSSDVCWATVVTMMKS
jgi:hypothetical protein